MPDLRINRKTGYGEELPLLKELNAFKPRPVAPASASPLDPELEKRLRALGYLQ